MAIIRASAIRKRILLKGWTVQRLSYESRLSTQIIYRIMAGKTDPSITTLATLASALDCKIQDLVPDIIMEDGTPVIADPSEGIVESVFN